ncbi:unnamed protein product [Symbiodinium necroappetens]|uniref:Uncharacterized protein n=1 Tax=Symbiodinium necroappetens TaxID=1628268 RepID=A0A812JW40_9DINO|nr:unnamed protein product [Symbiodinium necroappetens]
MRKLKAIILTSALAHHRLALETELRMAALAQAPFLLWSGAGSKTSPEKRWRSGAVPQPPSFDGDIEADPYCYRHYKRRLLRWVEITKEYLPGNEQALRALENLKGEAEVEMEEVEDSRYNVPNGIQLLLQDLEKSFGAKEMFRQGGTIREFENVGRLQGESVHAFVRRFRLLERKLKDNQVPEYPEVARVIKLLDGLRLDEKSVSALLLAFHVFELTDAAEAAAHWNTTWEEAEDPPAEADGGDHPTDDFVPYYEEGAPAEEEAEDPATYDGEDHVDDEDDGAAWGDYEAGDGDFDENEDLHELMQALTVTSKRLAGLVQARGFYQTDGKGKSKGKGQPPKGKGKGKVDNALQQHAAIDGLVLDAEGAASIWAVTVSANEPQHDDAAWDVGKQHYQAPSLSEFEPVTSVPTSPSILLQYYQGDSSAYIIADTGCQRQVAGEGWHAQKRFEIEPLCRLEYPDVCKFSFGPSDALTSQGRYVYPAAIAGKPLAMCVSSVKAKAPALMSRKAFEALGAVPDVYAGTIYFRALQCSSQLWLSPCGHLAIRLDEWGKESFPWPPLHVPEQLPDVIHPDSLVSSSSLPTIENLFNFVFYVKQMVILYSATMLHPALKDRVMQTHLVPSSATTLLSTTAAMAAQESLQSQKYMRTPEACNHPSGMRAYGAAGIRVRICDLCGTRYVLLPSGTSVLATPKASPSAKTPLNLPEHVMEAIRGKKPATGKPQGTRSQGSSRPSSTSSPAYAPPPPPRLRTRSSTTAPKAAPKMVPRAKSMMQTASAGSNLPIPRRRQWHGSESDRMSTGTGVYHEDMDWSEAAAPAENAEWVEPNWAMPDDYDQYEGSENSQFDPNDLIPHDFEEEEENEAYDKDAGAFKAKTGTLKRVHGNEKALLDAWKLEQRAYEVRTQKARSARVFGSDLIEIYGGNAEITRVGLHQALRVLQPIDKVYGYDLDTGKDFEALRKLLLKHRPFLVIFEFPCTLWSNIQRLNYDKLMLEDLRAKQLSSIREMCKTIRTVHDGYGGHFLLENPAYTPFWQHPEIMRLYDIANMWIYESAICAATTSAARTTNS